MAVVTIYKAVLVHDELAHFKITVEFSSRNPALTQEEIWASALARLSWSTNQFKLEFADSIGTA